MTRYEMALVVLALVAPLVGWAQALWRDRGEP